MHLKKEYIIHFLHPIHQVLFQSTCKKGMLKLYFFWYPFLNAVKKRFYMPHKTRTENMIKERIK